MHLILLVFAIASERIDIPQGRLPPPGTDRCIRLHATGKFQHAKVFVNQLNAGELADESAELDITGLLSTGTANVIEVRGAEQLWAWVSAPVYIGSARRRGGDRVEVSVVNTTENTAQVEIAGQQFTVSPGTTVVREFPSEATRLQLRAVSDGLDREFVDEFVVIP